MNANLLRAKIKEQGKTQAEVAKLVGLSENSLSRKMTGKRDFRLQEVVMLIDALSIDDPVPIFLIDKSQKCNEINDAL